MANDYNGYIATYREYQRGDHYRKALTGWGPHSSDYMATRLVTMGRQLKYSDLPLPKDQVQEQALAGKVAADLEVNEARATALGQVGDGRDPPICGHLPDDGGSAEVVAQPANMSALVPRSSPGTGARTTRTTPWSSFSARLDGRWQPFADQSGELQVTLEFPQGTDVASYLSGDQEWRWTAHFEAFVSPFDPGERPRATPTGVYRFPRRRAQARERQGDALPPGLAVVPGPPLERDRR